MRFYRQRYLACLACLWLTWLISPVCAQPTPEYVWYRNAIVYALDVDTFKDSNGDGMGDFNGVIQQLDYLQGLGVTVLWLSPFQPTPDRDDGYDITNYYGVDPRLGSAGDFAEFMFQARQRGIRVIMDLVINHTSDEHPWFKSARQRERSPYRSWYVWRDKRPADADKGMVFPGVQKETWTLDSVSRTYYYHRFYDFQPDLNYSNPLVEAESKRVIGYWLNQGFSGFRLDAVPFIIEVDGKNVEQPDHRFNQLMALRRHVQLHGHEAILLGEANVAPDENKDYFGKDGNGMQMMFNFFVNQHLFYALATGELEPLVRAMEQTRDIPEGAQWANFLRNHDEIDLGRLTTAQREKIYTAMGPDKNMQLYDRGIRRRLAPMLGNNQQRLAMAYSLLFALPGTPVIRYGEEIGMGDNLQLKERLSVRTPMQWTDEAYAGFSTTKPFRPVIDAGEYDYRKVNVEAQRADPASLLTLITTLIQLRKEHPAIGLGKWIMPEHKAPGLLMTQFTDDSETILTVHNFAGGQATTELACQGKFLIDLFSGQRLPVKNGKVQLTVKGYGHHWFQVR
ncbi:alpha-amylase family protein [Fulvivirgaceae bacterium PWU5]|uniref:Alpha-amylase family protein n=1 Tax=Dawidia cretensis TaxID=2782350 RepID=A0AAP2DXG9_9BACT|nr:alpha-amylase family protein [Dawidia cretensis]MBT1708174.1 alpha-amylase family protein [Dawidia cretensis]